MALIPLLYFTTVLRSYSWFVVYSYFEELKEKNKINKAAALLKKSQVNKEQEALKEDIKANCTISPAWTIPFMSPLILFESIYT